MNRLSIFPHTFSRYAHIIDDWQAFTTSLQQPLPRNLWLNPLKLLPPQKLHLQELETWKSVAGFPHTYTTSQEDLGNHWAYHAGLFHLQELVSMLPVKILDPQPGERILDLCAAPGSKTMQLALALKNSGTVVANDKNYNRMKALRYHLERLGLVNVTTTTFDGATYPAAAGLFDKVLADVPCSGEGTSRKKTAPSENSNNVHNIKALQKRILHRAIMLCKPGGTILYSTCTYAPEENEWVINTILNEHPEISLMPISLDGLKFSSGIEKWEGEQFRSELALTVRLWPHQNNTGGFYLALLRKADNADITNSTDSFTLESNTEEIEQLLEYLFPYSFSENIINKHIIYSNKRGLFIVNKDHQSVRLPKPDGIGMHMLKTGIRYPKLTTAAAKWLGQYATRQFVELNSEQIYKYLQREEILLTNEQVDYCSHTGYVIVRYQGYGLGMGIMRSPLLPGKWRLESLYPKN